MPTPSYTNINLTGITSGITAISATQDMRNFDYDSYSWTLIQQLINNDVHVGDLHIVLASKNITKDIIKRALFLNKITRKNYIKGRDFT